MDGLDISVVAISIADKSIKCINVTLASSIGVFLCSKPSETSKGTLIVTDRVDLMVDGSIGAQIHFQSHKFDHFKFHDEAGLSATPRDQQSDGFTSIHFASLNLDLSFESTSLCRIYTI